MNKLAKFVVCFLILFGTTQTLFADAGAAPVKSSGYIKVATGLMISGGVLAGVGGANAFEDGGAAAFYSGVGIFAAGTGILIWGLSNRSHSFRDTLEAAQTRSFIVGVSPLKKGGTATAVLRW
ncbi:MAG TPA: hypothetical protein VLH08_14465 [Acidobacteriota bacterium]|nr:hypothetical protein [Acidobacteriota bacterium]